MIPYEFEYKRAHTLDEAVMLMTDYGDHARLLAGGHSLIPAMKLRLSNPTMLIDISKVDELTQITNAGDALHIGAAVTHRAVEDSNLVKARCRVLAEAAGEIGDPQVRNKGTIGGSLAHADPAADYPALMLALDATIEVVGPSGVRTISADDFFQDLFTTALVNGEIITKVTVPVLGANTGAAYAKFPNPASKYAVVGVAAKVTLDGQGTCTAARLGITGAGPSAFRATGVEQVLIGQPLNEQTIGAAVADMVDPADLMSDLGGSAEYRAHLCSVMAARALTRAGQTMG
ncbi:MAG: FAD binding domain-containing protein [Rhodothermales bacterium]